MCGFVGFYDPNGAVHDPQARLIEMTSALTRRGPDDHGYYHNGPWHLGHRRLSILDLSEAGRQPMISDDGNAVLTFNGEIYNFEAIRAALGDRSFRTRTDTEVLLRALQEEGAGALARLNGMFGFAFLDRRHNRLILARDRAGKKPVYYTQQNGVFAFASELKALACLPELTQRLDQESLRLFLSLDYIPSPKTIYHDIHKLPGGHVLTFENGRIDIDRYWQLRFLPKAKNQDEHQLREEFHSRMGDAVALRLVADRPVGILLSGGIDSSTVAWFAKQASSGPVRTFSIRFEDESYDESSYARRVAAELGTEHHEFEVSAKDALDRVDSIFNYLDEPFADPSIIPTAILCENTVSRVTVAVGGDGADELFYGYPTYQAERWARMLDPCRLLTPALRAAGRLAPVSDRYMSFGFKLDRFLRGLNTDPLRRHFLWRGPMTPSELNASLLAAGNGGGLDAMIGEIRSNGPYADELEPILYEDFRFYLQDNVLVKVDRASMMHSLEVRAPFLDQRIIEFAASLPRAVNFRGGQTKAFLKEAMRGKLPDDILFRKKQGFAVPVSAWLKSELKELFLDLHSDARLKSQGLFHAKVIHDIYRDHCAGKRDARKELWASLAFQLWYEKYGKMAACA